jgi:hypothetical protein
VFIPACHYSLQSTVMHNSIWIKELNDWLFDNEKGNHFEYAPNKHKRDYYVRKLIELEENQLGTIKV